MPQYALSLSLPPLFSADNFIIGECNEEAWRWVNAWPNWSASGPSHALLLTGPAGCGKSHLGQVWAQRAGALTLPASGLTGQEPGKSNLLLEDIEQVKDQTHLLHLFNYTRENGHSLLMTSAHAPKALPFTLPDLTSRLLAVPAVAITEADDSVLAGAMRKQFSDRQMKVDDEVIAYTLPRIERSLGKIKELVEYLDSAALAERKNITIPFVKKILDQQQSQPLL